MAAELGLQGFEFIEPEETTSAATSRWRRLLRHLLRVRRLQRLWGHLGGFLRTQFPSTLRDRLRDAYP